MGVIRDGSKLIRTDTMLPNCGCNSVAMLLTAKFDKNIYI